MREALIGAILAAIALGAALPAAAQPVSMCQAIAERIPDARYVRVTAPARPAPPIRAALARPVQAESYEVDITYVGHSTFRIVSPEGVVIATDFAGFAGEGPLPTVVTMNHAHSSHFTNAPDSGIANVLRGWNAEGEGPAEHHVQIGDVFVRNVPTDIRSYGMVEPYGNSIFIFETAGLCIGHLGHLHHIPSDEHYAEIGRLDLVFAPVDGSYTMNQVAMLEVVKRLRASIVVPMHFFTTSNLTRFVTGMRSDFAIDIRSDPHIRVSLNTLPDQPTLVVLPGY